MPSDGTIHGIDIPQPVNVSIGMFPEPCVGLSVGGELVRLSPDEAKTLAKWLSTRATIAKRLVPGEPA